MNTKRKIVVPIELDITISDEQEVVLMLMFQDGIEINCRNICKPRYWNPQWTKCPLCGAIPNIDGGFWVHQLEH